MRLQTHAFTRLAGSLQELGIYGKLRKVQNCGPMSMFRALLVAWKVSAHCSAVACNTSAGLHRAVVVHWQLCCSAVRWPGFTLLWLSQVAVLAAPSRSEPCLACLLHG